MSIFYDIGELITKQFNTITGKNKTFKQLTLSPSLLTANYPIVAYRIWEVYTTVTDDEGTIVNIFYNRTTSTNLKTIITQRGFPLMEDASTTIHSLINSINKAYGTSFTTLDIVDGVFAPLTQTSVTITFKPTSTYFNDSGSITLTVLGTYRIDDGKVVGTPVVYDYMPGVWDERTAGLQATTKQTGVKWSVLHHTYRVDYTPIGNILARFQGMPYTADTRRLTRTYWRDILLPNALKSVDGLDWCNDTLSVRPFNLYLGYILYNGPANRCKGYFANMAATLFEQYATDLVDTTYDYVMILSGGVGGYLPAVIHYNLGTIRS